MAWTEEQVEWFVCWKEQYEKVNEIELLRRPFVNSDDLVNECKTWIHNESGIALSAKDIRDLAQAVERKTLWKVRSTDIADHLEIRKANLKDFGNAKGLPAIDQRNNSAVGIYRKNLSPEYIRYRDGHVWKARSKQYLDKHNWNGQFYICALCGRERERHEIHVHYNTYSALDGTELDIHLVGVCAGRCHDLADLARYCAVGRINEAELNDALRPLLSLTR